MLISQVYQKSRRPALGLYWTLRAEESSWSIYCHPLQKDLQKSEQNIKWHFYENLMNIYFSFIQELQKLCSFWHLVVYNWHWSHNAHELVLRFHTLKLDFLQRVHFHVCTKVSDTFEKVWLIPRLWKKCGHCGQIYTYLACLRKHIQSQHKKVLVNSEIAK